MRTAPALVAVKAAVGIGRSGMSEAEPLFNLARSRIAMATFHTIGHSNRSLEELIEMLREGRVNLLVDVRSYPRSRTNPVFNIDTLPNKLSEVQISYRHCRALGGRRSRQKAVEESLNALWRVQSFHNYADYALGDEFGAALSKVIDLGSCFRIALMCSEAVWWRCHRRIITDYLMLNGHDVVHLMALGHHDHAKPTPGAIMTSNGKVLYPQSPTRGTLATTRRLDHGDVSDPNR